MVSREDKVGLFSAKNLDTLVLVYKSFYFGTCSNTVN